MPDHTALIRHLRHFPDRLTMLVDPLTPEQRTTVYLPGEWTVAQNVHHLADSHMQAYLRTKWVITVTEPTFLPYDQDAWAAQPHAMLADLTAPLTLLRGLHHAWANLFGSLTPDQWTRIGHHPEFPGDPITPARFLASYVAHGDGHIDQINRTLAAAPN